MSAAHTPTPWVANNCAIETVAEPSYVIGSVYEGDAVDIDSATADANAEFIVRAVNNFDGLVAALQNIANTYDDSFPVGCQERRIGDLARAALARAEAQS